ncbi:bifunctional fumarylacetoacetate hydrolase/alpha/beta hydrolase family protein [Aspergillus glaucus CBS 516.65]|uniref:AB hydrolase-1 domain-containing protein n=1 Tax=Aspergillus glaucus CBS 516.65 TaxID=1160497 RepID=A0A1L9VU50_ASPGL|nr:hypothetical protein ASPGLDRAFT_166223 [Aspergillus glaucus CBS 516.65]OJJ87453.1 hypothetical protein ASPGLDRAFT_166223 [Aspergillus glaucus CBS 516.65]
MSESPSNYCAYHDPVTGQARVGQLNFAKETINPLSFISGTHIESLYQVIEAGSENIEASGDAFPLSEVKLLPPIPGCDILTVGKNHAIEFNLSALPPSDKESHPARPLIFTKRATPITAHGDQVLPHADFTNMISFDGKIGVIIRKSGFRIPEKDAMDYIWGYTIVNDVVAGENTSISPDSFCSMGPVAIPSDKLPGDLRIETSVNGAKGHDSSLNQLIASIPRLINTFSQTQTLRIGDVFAIGASDGLGQGILPMDPTKFLHPGDEMKISASGLGSLANHIASSDLPSTTIERAKSFSHIPLANCKARDGNGLVRVGHKSLFNQVQGKPGGPPIIFIHGLGGSSNYYVPLLLRLSSTHELHLFDLEGHGLSPLNPLSKLTIASYMTDIKDLYMLRADRPATVIAHSMGSLVALKLAINHPELTSKLILMGPPPSPVPQAGVEGSIARANLVRSKGMLATADTVVNGATSAHTKDYNPVAMAAAKLSLMGQDPEGYANACLALARSGSETLDVSSIRIPTLILTGAEDAVGSPEVCRKYAESIVGAQVVVLPDVGHWHLFEDVRGVSGAIVSFL